MAAKDQIKSASYMLKNLETGSLYEFDLFHEELNKHTIDGPYLYLGSKTYNDGAAWYEFLDVESLQLYSFTHIVSNCCAIIKLA